MSPRNGRPEEKEGMYLSDPSQKTPPQRMSSRKGRHEEKEDMNQSNPFQKDPKSEIDYYYAATAVSPNAQHQDSEASFFITDHMGKPPPNPTQTLEEKHREELASQQPFLVRIYVE